MGRKLLYDYLPNSQHIHEILLDYCPIILIRCLSPPKNHPKVNLVITIAVLRLVPVMTSWVGGLSSDAQSIQSALMTVDTIFLLAEVWDEVGEVLPAKDRKTKIGKACRKLAAREKRPQQRTTVRIVKENLASGEYIHLITAIVKSMIGTQVTVWLPAKLLTQSRNNTWLLSNCSHFSLSLPSEESLKVNLVMTMAALSIPAIVTKTIVCQDVKNSQPNYYPT